MIVLFPHIHPNNPNVPYDFYSLNEKFKKFTLENDILLIDPLNKFLNYPEKQKLVVNPIDPHPTEEMNQLVSAEIMRQFNFQKYWQNHIAYLPVRKTAYINSTNQSIGSFQKIVNITSSVDGYPFVFFETKNNLDIQNFPLRDLKFRQTKNQTDFLHTAKSFTHDGWPGAGLTYYVKSKTNGEIQIPQNLYGFEAIGINSILALRSLSDGSTKGENLRPLAIKKENQNWLIQFDQKENFTLFKINLKVDVRQLDLSADGIIEKMTRTLKLQKIIDQETDVVILPVTEKVFPGSNLKFENRDYGYIDDEMVIFRKIDFNEKEIVLHFFKPVPKGKKVSVFVSAEYNLSENENLNIDIE